jgi:protease-4
MLVFSLFGNFSQLLSNLASPGAGFGSSGRLLEEAVIRDNDSRHRIAVIDVSGLILGSAWDSGGYGMVQHIKRQLRQAGENRTVRAVIIRVDSPGGEVMASDEISQAIKEFQKKYRKPAVASFGGVAASGGYYVAAPCQWIVANELTLTGSIGVIMQGYNYRGLMDKVGVRPEVFKSGKFKDMLRGSRAPEEIPPEERTMIQNLVDETYGRFKQVIRDGREQALERTEPDGRALVEDWERYADGRVLTGKQAFEHGFVDELGDFETAVKRTLKLARIADANLIRYQRPFSFGDMFRLFGRSESHAIKLDLGIDWPQLEAGRLYFLSPIVLP